MNDHVKKTEYLEDEEDDNLGLNYPQLGIYDTRLWDIEYFRHMKEDGPRPGAHPDPQCIWNQNPLLYRTYEYKENQKKLKKEAKDKGLI